MSQKIACVIPARWTMQDYERHTCGDRSHAHISRVELADGIRHGLMELVRHEDRRTRRKAIVRVVRALPARGLSCSVGEQLVRALATLTGRDWAQAMLAQIQMRRESRAA